MKGTQEFYDLLSQFEKDIKKQPGTPSLNFSREAKGSPHGVYYCDGTTNLLFIGYMAGYVNGKCAERLGLYEVAA